MEPQDPAHPFSDSPPPRQEPNPSQPPPSSPPLPQGQEPRQRPGRPLRLTREVLDRIVEAVEQGSYLKIAAQAAGVGQSTLAAWLARGRVAATLTADHADAGDEWTLPEEETPFLELLESVTRAQATAETTAVAAWRKAFTGHEPDWRAARDYLARVAPERWAGVTRVQMTTEEAERRIDDAVNEALTALGVDALDDEDDPAEQLAEQGES